MCSVSVPKRIARFAALVGHFASGLFTLAFRFGRFSPSRRIDAIQHWSRELLRRVGVQVEHAGELPAAGLIVMNHISWLDIIVLNALAPSRFVSKAEVARWPLVGYLCTKSGTLYIERGRKTAARRTNQLIAAALANGERVAVFPEGTTTPGDRVLPFHAALLQPAVASAGLAYPAALRYLDANGKRALAVSYGDESLIESVWLLLGAQGVVASVDFGPPESAVGRHRRELASALHADISRRLGCGSPHTTPALPAGHRASPP
jgi:1-acyl-sn-glycerol-3-phosphate acyltransferase